MNVLDSVLEVFTQVGEWFSTAFTNLIPIFYTTASGEASGQLTFVGVLAVAGLALASAGMLFMWIRDFLRFR